MTVEAKGKQRDYSLYPGGVIEGRDGPDAEPTASLYTKLTPQQEANLKEALDQPESYSSRNNNCSHFVSRVYEQTTGNKLSNETTLPNGVGGFQKVGAPAGLEHSIRSRELDPRIETRTVAERPPEKTQPAVQEPEKKHRPPIRSFREIHPDSGKDRSR